MCYLQVIRLGFEPKTHSLEGCCKPFVSYCKLLICVFGLFFLHIICTLADQYAL